MNYSDLDKLIESFSCALEERSPQKGYWNRVMVMRREIGSAFNNTSYPSIADKERAWELFQGAVDKARKRSKENQARQENKQSAWERQLAGRLGLKWRPESLEVRKEEPLAAEWYDFLEAVRYARRKLGDPEVVWYRGQSNGEWSLVSGLHRRSVGLAKEEILFAEFQRSAARLFTPRSNDWETLFDMQHYGVPTRLLDWTETLGVAVAFAVLDHHPSYGNPALWVLDPVGLNKYSGLKGIKDIPTGSFEYKAIYWRSDPFAAKYPIAVAPVLQNDRMIAQGGAFTIQGLDGRGIEESCSDAVAKVELPAQAVNGAREFLDHAGINSYSIYPDILGMARHIRRKHLGE